MKTDWEAAHSDGTGQLGPVDEKKQTLVLTEKGEEALQEYYRAIDIKRQRFLKALEELFREHDVSYRLMAGELDFLGDGFRFTPMSLFEALAERGM